MLNDPASTPRERLSISCPMCVEELKKTCDVVSTITTQPCTIDLTLVSGRAEGLGCCRLRVDVETLLPFEPFFSWPLKNNLNPSPAESLREYSDTKLLRSPYNDSPSSSLKPLTMFLQYFNILDCLDEACQLTRSSRHWPVQSTRERDHCRRLRRAAG